MFFRKSSAVVKAAVETSSQGAAGAALDEGALDALGEVLRTFGQQNVEADDGARDAVRELFESWATHVLLGRPLTNDAAEASARRDFRGAVRAFRAQRKTEVDRVTKALTDLRGAVWSFVSVLSRAALADERSDGAMRARLGRLKAAVDAGDVAALRAEAEGTVIDLGALIDARAAEHRARMEELAGEVRRLGRELEEAKREGEIDGLTRLFNRACFDRFAERTASLALLGTSASLLMIDVDHFKKVNDSYGHPAGDAVLRSVADAIFRTFPRRDDLVARYGGEEFAVVLRNTKRDDAVMLAERLLRSIRGLTVRLGEVAVKPTVSIGIAELGERDTVEVWIGRADAALYAAKNGGRDRAAAAP